MLKKAKNLKAFTLVEILIVIAILAILAVVTFAVINPAQRINDANDSATRTAVQGICKAIALYTVDNNGSLPTTSDPTSGTALPTVTDEADALSNGVAATTLEGLEGPYIATLPTDATGGDIAIGAVSGSPGQVICAANLTSGTYSVIN